MQILRKGRKVTNDWETEFRAKLRKFMEDEGEPVLFVPKHYEWQEDDQVSTYGWHDWDAVWHCKPGRSHPESAGCHWIVPEGAVAYEREYSQFTDTFHDNEDEVGINVRPAHCACGKYTDVTLRYVGSLAEVIRELTGTPKRPTIEL